MARYVVRRLQAFVFKHPKVCLFSIFILVCTFLPLRYPNWMKYKKISLSDIVEDLDRCPNEVSRPGEEPCTLDFKSLGTSTIRIQRTINTTQLEILMNSVKPGGAWKSVTCTSQFRVAIIVPYRNREEQLTIFLQHVHQFLQNQKLDYQLFVIEQSKDHKFNRGMMFNIGYQEALKIRNFCCFIFHDVDLLPESPQHIYSCSKMPRHMSTSIDIFRYVLPYPGIFGGVVAISRQHFSLVNGFSNMFFGWGAEDDNLYRRIVQNGLEIVRWEPSISRYTMLSHKKAEPNPSRNRLLEKLEDADDGLNSLKYNVLERELKPLYTWILVDVKPP